MKLRNQKWISILTIVAILGTLLCGFGVTAAAEESVVVAEKPQVNKVTEMEEDFLLQLGIIRTPWPAEREDYMAKESTRAGMAQMMSRVAGLEPYTGEETYFNDVPATHTNAKEINALARAGILRGDGNGKFRPDDPITPDEMATVCSIILGYKILGDNETYPVVANRIGLYDGVELSGNLTIGQFYRMLLNTLDTEMMEQTTFGDKTEFKVVEGYTCLERYHGLVKQRGIVDGVYGTRLSDVDISIREGQMLVNGKTYYWEDTADLLGKAVVLYSERDRATGETKPNVEYLYVDPEMNSAVKISGEDVIGFEGRYFKYYTGSNEKKIPMAGAPDVVANGVAFPEYVPADLKPACGNVTLLDNDGDAKYDVVFIEDYTFMMLSSVDQENGILYGKYPAGASIGSKNQEEIYQVFMTDGVDGELGFLLPGDMVAIQSSRNKTGPKQITVTYLGEGVTGVLEGIYKNTYTIGGVPYEITAGTILDNDDYILGQTVTVYTHEGYCGAMIHASNDSYKFGYMIDAKVDEKGFGGNLRARIANQNRELMELTAPKEFMLDESKYNDASRALTQLRTAADKRIYAPDTQSAMDGGNISRADLSGLDSEGVLTQMKAGEAAFPLSQPVRYRLNNEGELTHIDTLLKGTNETEQSLIPYQVSNGKTDYAEIEAGAYNYYDRSFYVYGGANGGKSIVTLMNLQNIIMPPYEHRDETKWYGTGSLGNDFRCLLEAYTVNDYNIARYAVVYNKEQNTVYESNKIYILSDVERVLDEEGEVVRKVTFSGHGGAGPYIVDESVADSALVIGSVSRFQVDTDNNVVAIETIWEPSQGDPASNNRVVEPKSNTYYPWGRNNRLAYGTALAQSDGMISHTTSIGSELYLKENFRNYMTDVASFFRYTEKDGEPKVEMAGPMDLVPYDTDRSTKQKTIMITNAGRLQVVYIIEKD